MKGNYSPETEENSVLGHKKDAERLQGNRSCVPKDKIKVKENGFQNTEGGGGATYQYFR